MAMASMTSKTALVVPLASLAGAALVALAEEARLAPHGLHELAFMAETIMFILTTSGSPIKANTIVVKGYGNHATQNPFRALQSPPWECRWPFCG